MHRASHDTGSAVARECPSRALLGPNGGEEPDRDCPTTTGTARPFQAVSAEARSHTAVKRCLVTAREERSESHVQRRASLHIPHVRCGTISTKSQRSADFLMRWLYVSAMESALICVICGQSAMLPSSLWRQASLLALGRHGSQAGSLRLQLRWNLRHLCDLWIAMGWIVCTTSNEHPAS